MANGDPRRADNPADLTPNEFLQDQAIRHRVGLMRTAGSIRNDLISKLNEVDDEIEERVSFNVNRASSEGTVRTRQLRQLQNELQSINQDVMDDVKGNLADRLDELGKGEADMARERIERAIPVEVQPSMPSENQLTAIMSTNPMEGKTLSQWAETESKFRTRKIMSEVRSGLIAGDGNDEIVDRVMGTRQFGFKDGVMNQSRKNVEAITRTAVNNVSNTARELTYQRNADIVKNVKYVATLDSRTTVICASLGGQVFEPGKGPRPPQHFNCRSATAPVIKGWREMGIDPSKMGPQERAAMNGTVPGDMDFEGWLTQQGAGVRKEILGKTRKQLWEKGDLDLQKFLSGGIKQHNEIMDLDTLRQTQQEAFERAGLAG